MHYRATIPEMTARHVIVDLLASGQVARMNAGWLATRPLGSRPTLQRFWGTVCQDGEAAYLAPFLTPLSLPGQVQEALLSGNQPTEPRLAALHRRGHPSG